jgi:hypothetical protein
MTFLEKLRNRREAWRRERAEEEAGQLEAEARGEAYTLGERKDAVRDERSETDFPSRGAGYTGR